MAFAIKYGDYSGSRQVINGVTSKLNIANILIPCGWRNMTVKTDQLMTSTGAIRIYITFKDRRE